MQKIRLELVDLQSRPEERAEVVEQLVLLVGSAVQYVAIDPSWKLSTAAFAAENVRYPAHGKVELQQKTRGRGELRSRGLALAVVGDHAEGEPR